MDKRRERRGIETLAIDRRSFFKVSAGSMAALSVHSAYTMDALAQENPALSGLEFFTDPQAQTVEAIAEQIWPTTEDSVGGRDAGVLYYIDRALAGPYEPYRSVYRTGIDWLDEASQQEYDAAFRSLDAEQQLALMTSAFSEGEEAAPEAATPQVGTEGPLLAAATPVPDEQAVDGQPLVAGLVDPQISTLRDFLDIVRLHTMEGLFADPIYGGNRDFAGWRAVGYPGPYYIYTEEEQQSFEPLDKPFQSIADL